MFRTKLTTISRCALPLFAIYREFDHPTMGYAPLSAGTITAVALAKYRQNSNVTVIGILGRIMSIEIAIDDDESCNFCIDRRRFGDVCCTWSMQLGCIVIAIVETHVDCCCRDKSTVEHLHTHTEPDALQCVFIVQWLYMNKYNNNNRSVVNININRSVDIRWIRSVAWKKK